MEHFELDGYTCKRELGTGATGSVYLAEKDGTDYALKVLVKNLNDPNYERLHKNMEIEIAALKKVGDHPYIMKIVGAEFNVAW